MMSEEEIKAIIDAMEDKSIPAIMKKFKSEYAGKVDMGLVNRIARASISKYIIGEIMTIINKYLKVRAIKNQQEKQKNYD